MTRVFIDSSFFKAFVDPKDDFHTRAKGLWKKFVFHGQSLVTSNYILDETYTLIRCKLHLQKALQLRGILSHDALNLDVIRVTVDDDACAWGWFEKNWSKLSFTDCVSFAVMKRIGLTDVATFDTHFKRAGFTIVNTTRLRAV
ncbi:MAG: hypothetical protein UW22_C0013G0019 [Candidatus Gottesmanbacteria bacterium GW2011_GWB1_44_11c]|uniref:Ribonuclease VapC n=1 Tax=Candidatus Gottesmanbacteria bacterium GW2011_GWB1_44_11c TaxID=1618447 RepID=A0A0G1J251_9BACT|nr:MAG: hypothetical protein UW22_C0013G0019 [Candidatus Gottesmanbacteria bacterium GW2011_GWB1_44_11c]